MKMNAYQNSLMNPPYNAHCYSPSYDDLLMANYQADPYDFRDQRYGGHDPFGQTNFGYEDYTVNRHQFKPTHNQYTSNFSPHPSNFTPHHLYQASSFQSALYFYQPTEFAKAPPNLCYADVISQGTRTMDFIGSTGMARNDNRFEHTSPPFLFQQQHTSSNGNNVSFLPLLERTRIVEANDGLKVSAETIPTYSHVAEGHLYDTISSSHGNCSSHNVNVHQAFTLNVTTAYDEGNIHINLDLSIDGLDQNRAYHKEAENDNKVFVEMTSSNVEDMFDILAPISSNLIEHGQVERTRWVDSEPESKVGAPKVLLKGNGLEEANPLKKDESPTLGTLLEPTQGLSYHDELGVLSERVENVNNFYVDVNEYDPSTTNAVIAQVQNSSTIDGVTSIAAHAIIKSSQGKSKGVLKLYEEFSVVEEKFEAAETKISCLEGNKVVDDREEMSHLIRCGSGEELREETLHKCEKVKKSDDRSNKRTKKREHKKSVLLDSFYVVPKSLNSYQVENKVFELLDTSFNMDEGKIDGVRHNEANAKIASKVDVGDIVRRMEETKDTVDAKLEETNAWATSVEEKPFKVEPKLCATDSKRVEINSFVEVARDTVVLGNVLKKEEIESLLEPSLFDECSRMDAPNCLQQMFGELTNKVLCAVPTAAVDSGQKLVCSFVAELKVCLIIALVTKKPRPTAIDITSEVKSSYQRYNQIKDDEVTNCLRVMQAHVDSYDQGPKATNVDENNELIFDPGIFEVYIFTIGEDILDVKTVAGYTCLGGEDLDNGKEKGHVQKLRKKNEKDSSSHPYSGRRAGKVCKSVTMTCLPSSWTTSAINSFYEGVEFYSAIICVGSSMSYKMTCTWDVMVSFISKTCGSSIAKEVLVTVRKQLSKFDIATLAELWKLELEVVDRKSSWGREIELLLPWSGTMPAVETSLHELLGDGILEVGIFQPLSDPYMHFSMLHELSVILKKLKDVLDECGFKSNPYLVFRMTRALRGVWKSAFFLVKRGEKCIILNEKTWYKIWISEDYNKLESLAWKRQPLMFHSFGLGYGFKHQVPSVCIATEIGGHFPKLLHDKRGEVTVEDTIRVSLFLLLLKFSSLYCERFSYPLDDITLMKGNEVEKLTVTNLLARVEANNVLIITYGLVGQHLEHISSEGCLQLTSARLLIPCGDVILKGSSNLPFDPGEIKFISIASPLRTRVILRGEICYNPNIGGNKLMLVVE